MRKFLVLGAIAMLAANGAIAAPAKHGLTGAEFAPQTRITLVAARAAALKARPGVITDQELEKEAGGSGLRYSFDIKSHGKTFEVGIDAVTGRVLENAPEGPNPD